MQLSCFGFISVPSILPALVIMSCVCLWKQNRAVVNLFRGPNLIEDVAGTLQRLEQGDLKLRVRALDSERALARVLVRARSCMTPSLECFLSHVRAALSLMQALTLLLASCSCSVEPRRQHHAHCMRFVYIAVQARKPPASMVNLRSWQGPAMCCPLWASLQLGAGLAAGQESHLSAWATRAVPSVGPLVGTAKRQMNE